MEIAYSVGVSNRFASLMADEDDPGDQTITPANAPEKIEKEKPRKDFKSAKQKDNREKGQQTRKNVQDPTKRMQYVHLVGNCCSRAIEHENFDLDPFTSVAYSYNRLPLPCKQALQ